LPVVRYPLPGARECSWAEFKNRYPDDRLYSIEILTGGPNLQLGVYDDSIKRGQVGPEDKACRGFSSPMMASDDVPPHQFYRIRIQSGVILHLLNVVSGDSWDITKSHSFVRPFAYLIHHQQKVKDEFKRLSSLASSRATSNSDENELETGDPRLVMSVKDVLDDICVYINFVDSELVPLYHQFENTNDASQTIQFDDL